SAEAIQWFKWVEAPANGGWDTVFLPRGQWYFSETEPNSRVYIFNGDETKIEMQKTVRIRPGNQPYTVSGMGTYKEYDYFDYAVTGEAGQTVMICSTVDDYLSNNIFRLYKSDLGKTATVSIDGGVSAPENIDIVTDDFEVELNYSRLGVCSTMAAVALAISFRAVFISVAISSSRIHIQQVWSSVRWYLFTEMKVSGILSLMPRVFWKCWTAN
ncbi:MAG: hypothetical protein GX028_08180, partial [Clostridiaceae bacterium]|nr:hypothetical protein [Clostridiaceae bacterium]